MAPVAVQNVVGAGTYTIATGEVSAPAVHAYTHAGIALWELANNSSWPIQTNNTCRRRCGQQVGGETAPAVHTYVFKAPAVAVYSGFRGNWKNPEVAAIWNSRSFRAPAVVNWYSRPQVLVVDDESKVAAPRPAPLPIAPTVQHVGYNVHHTYQNVPQAPVVGAAIPVNQQPVILTTHPAAPAVAAYYDGPEAPVVAASLRGVVGQAPVVAAPYVNKP